MNAEEFVEKVKEKLVMLSLFREVKVIVNYHQIRPKIKIVIYLDSRKLMMITYNFEIFYITLQNFKNGKYNAFNSPFDNFKVDMNIVLDEIGSWIKAEVERL